MKLGNQPAFPLAAAFSDAGTPDERMINAEESGMTLRQYYAGLAMAAILSGADLPVNRESVARDAVYYTEALLEVLGRQQ